MLYVFEGDGKGKTSAALGVAVRMLSLGKRVLWVSWFKMDSWGISEMKLPSYFGGLLEMHWMGEGFVIKNGKKRMTALGEIKMAKVKSATVYDTKSLDEHKIVAEEALKLVERRLSASAQKPDLVVMDEVIRAVTEGLITQEEVLSVVRKRGEIHMVLTGHDCPKEIVDEADLVTEMKKVKHPYDKGILAVKGLDY